MKHRLLRPLTAFPLATLLLFQASAGTGPITASAFDMAKFQRTFHGHLSGFLDFELNAGNAVTGAKPSNYYPRGSDSCPVNLSSNIKVNQNCLNISDPGLEGRGQAQNETAVSQDPNNPNHMIATFNDYRRGDANCYGAYSLDKGRNWNDTTLPMSFTRGAAFGGLREYWQAGGDTSVAWDSKGNAYFSCQVFARGNAATTNVDQSSALLVFRSTQNNGGSWNFPGRYVTVTNDVAGSGLVLEDKQYIAVDNRVGSPFQDRIYVTWTHYDFAANTAYIVESHSSDYGEHFSLPVPVSPRAPFPLCPFPISGAQGGCDNNQFSQPFVGPDGALYVVWANYNGLDFTASPVGEPRFSVLLAKSVDGGVSFSPPTKVSDFFELPDCATAQNGADPGRACVPEKNPTNDSIFRATNYPVGAVNPTKPNQVVVSIGSYINVDSNEANGCHPVSTDPSSGGGIYTGTKVAGACNNKILLSVSNDSGVTFSGAAIDPRVEETVNQDGGQARTDQWFQWLAFNKNGKLAISYYDRQYGTDEATGFSDFSLSGSGDLVSFVVLRVTSGSMPPPTQFGGVFWGDYTGLSAVDNAYPIWSDTRVPDLFICPGGGPPTTCGQTTDSGFPVNDQDIFVAALPIPSK